MIFETTHDKRDGLRELQSAVEMARGTDVEAKRDRRFAVTARNIRLVADTLDKGDDGVWVDVAMLDVAGEEVLSSLIAAWIGHRLRLSLALSSPQEDVA
jgi:hypothetical protein